jgi:hypothetical protein
MGGRERRGQKRKVGRGVKRRKMKDERTRWVVEVYSAFFSNPWQAWTSSS